MALRVPKSSHPQLFKEGYKQYQGIDEAVLRNISACHELAETVRTSFGPNGKDNYTICSLYQRKKRNYTNTAYSFVH